MRPLRHFAQGLPVHLVHRGHNRQRIFHCTRDFLLFRHFLGEAAAELHVAVHGYVLMTNHVHLLLTPQRDGWDISRAMQSAGRRYVWHFNTRYQRTGALWENRFHSSIIESEHHLLACHRYVDLNPVRAQMVQRPEYYRWSSHRHYAEGKPDSLVTPHSLVLSLGADAAGRERAYKQLFEGPLAAEDFDQIRKAIRSGRPLGCTAPARRRGRPKKIDPDTNFPVTPPDTAQPAAAMR
jgi:putative transposase